MEFRKSANYIFLIFLIVCGCKSSSDEKDINSVFKKRYGKEVTRINSDRILVNKDGKPLSAFEIKIIEIEDDLEKTGSYYGYIDVNKFNDEKMPQNFLPDGALYLKASPYNPSNSVPNGIFDIVYNTDLHPPFRKAGIEFDNIQIPDRDSYGVSTQTSQKSYIFVGNDTLQKNIDHVNRTRTKEDLEVIQEFISEKKNIRRQKQAKNQIDSFEVARLEDSGNYDEKNSGEKIEDKKKSSDEFSKNTASSKKSSIKK